MCFSCSWGSWLRSSCNTCAGIGDPNTPSNSCHRGGLPHATHFSWTLDSAAAQQPKVFQVKQCRVSYWHVLLNPCKYFLEVTHLIHREVILMQSPHVLSRPEGLSRPPNCNPNLYHLYSELTEVMDSQNKTQGVR